MFSGSNLVLALTLACLSNQIKAAPCDIYAAGNTPCVAAHSTTRALYDKYSGLLYTVTRGSDNTSKPIGTLSPGGVANAHTQDLFCASTTCTITTIFDQSGNHNDLYPAPPGGAYSGPGANGYDIAASAVGAPVTLNGQRAYGVFIEPTSGYRNDTAVGTATGDQPQGMYAVFDATHYNNRCCFDYGNAETNNLDTGNGHMEAIYFGSGGAGNSKQLFIQADLENGLFASGNTTVTPQSITYQFVTAIVKGEPGTWAIRGGNAASGSLSTFWNGPRPQGGYNPMHKEGAIVLGIGGDNSLNAQGTFYEGVMTSGYPTSATEDAVQANIVSAGYAQVPLTSGPAFSVGSVVTLRATTACCTSDYIIHSGTTVNIQPVSSSSSSSLKQQGSWTVVKGLGNANCYSFESVDTPGSYLQQNQTTHQISLSPSDNTQLFNEDATFCPQVGLNGQANANSIRSWNSPTRFFRHYGGVLYLAANGGPEPFDAPTLFNNDTSFVMGSGF